MSKYATQGAAVRRMIRLAVAGAVLLTLAACGNKGPLVMPQKPVPVEAEPATPHTPPPAAEPPADATQPVDGAIKPFDDHGNE